MADSRANKSQGLGKLPPSKTSSFLLSLFWGGNLPAMPSSPLHRTASRHLHFMAVLELGQPSGTQLTVSRPLSWVSLPWA